MNSPALRPDPDLLRLTYVMYGLHLFSALTGVITSVAVVTAFLTGWPSLLALIMNYIKRSDVRGTMLDSHFVWQQRTFWFAFLWLLVAALLAVTVILIPLVIALVFVVGIWVIYRMMRGVVALQNNEPMPLP